MRLRALLLALAFACVALSSSDGSAAEVSTLVYINGAPAPVYFNDGDSFRVLDGALNGTRARLAGFNTLESVGPVHSWGRWHTYELYILGKRAAQNARRGVWHCTTEGGRDGYGRMLFICPDLAVDHIRKGLAMAYNIDDRPARGEYVRAMRTAIAERRGIWFHGVPEFVMTSVHSMSEDPTRASASNRLISTIDGHSESHRHTDTYGVCQLVCNDEVRVDHAKVLAVARALREDPQTAPLVQALYNDYLINLVSRWARKSELPEWATVELPEAARTVLATNLEARRVAGELGTRDTVRGACMTFVPFERWYGADRAACLDHH